MKTFLISTAAIAILATSVSAGGTPGAGFLDSWDGDANGAVTLAEIAEKRESIFFTFDENGDGSLTAEEYVAFDEARAADHASEGHGKNGGGHGQGAVGMTFEFNDVDGNGEVSMAEFIGQSEAWFAMMDRNGDGEVTSADFGRQ